MTILNFYSTMSYEFKQFSMNYRIKNLLTFIVIMVFLISCGTESNIDSLSDSVISTPTHDQIDPRKTSTIVSSPTTPPAPTATPEVEALFIYSRGVNLLRAEKFTESVNVFSTVIKRMPNLAIAYKSRAAAYYHLERLDLSRSDLKKAMILDVDLGGTHLYLGLIHEKEGDLEKAIKELQMAVNLIHPVREMEEFMIAKLALQNLTK